MALLASRTFVLTPTTDRYLQLDNSEWVRQLSIGNTWTKIRLGALIAITPTGTSDIVPKFVLGMCSGSTNTFGASSTDNFVGAGFIHALTLTYNAGAGNPYFTSSNSSGFISRVGMTVNYVGGLTGAFWTNDGSLQRRCPVFVEIEKGSPNYSVRTYTPATSENGEDVSYDNFLSAMEIAGDIATVGTVTMNNVLNTQAASEGPGNLNHVNIFWSLETTPLDVYAIAAKRIS